MQTSIVAPPLADEIKRMGERIAELEAALHRVWALSMAVQAEIDNDGPETSVTEINGLMVEIATECSRWVGKREND